MIQVNAAGRKVKDLGIEEPRPGTDIYLTLDLDVQKAAEEGLGERAGAVVAMDPNSGEILALASHPNYDPNLFPRGISPKDWVRLMNDPSHPLYNRAIQSVYPPGSTFKIIVSLAGLESGVIKLDDKVTCTGSPQERQAHLPVLEKRRAWSDLVPRGACRVLRRLLLHHGRPHRLGPRRRVCAESSGSGA